MLDEGLEAAWARHAECGELLQEGLEELGFELFAEEGHRLPELTTVWVPDDAAGRHRRSRGAARAARALRHRDRRRAGAVAGKVWRIGCMGHTARPRNVTLLLGALEPSSSRR